MSRRSQRIKNLSQDPKAMSATSAEGTGTIATRSGGRASTFKTRRVQTLVPEDVTNKVEKVARAPRRRGKLCWMLDMPLDVILEICVHLQTKDMLNLSRLSKAFRALFTNKSTRYIWRAARHNTPHLPPRPQDLNELAYANLLFDPSCHNCLSRNCHFVYWGCRVRLCKKCFDALTVFIHPWSIKEYHLYDDTTKKILDDRSQVAALIPPLFESPNGAWVQYRPLLDSLVLAWKATPKEKREKFIKRQESKTAAIAKTVPALTKWYDDFRKSRADELDDIRKARQNAIVENLKDDGWGLEVEYIMSTNYEKLFRNLPEVRKTQALTPLWSTIQPRINKFMLEIRPKYLHDLHIRTIQDRLFAADKLVKEILSGMQDFKLHSRELAFCSRKFRDLIDPKNKDFDIEALRPTFQELVVEYLEERECKAKRTLLNMIRKEVHLKRSTDPFSVAIGSYFTCSECYKVFAYRNAVRHICRYPWTKSEPKQKWMSDDYYSAVTDWYILSRQGQGQSMWSAEVYRPQLEKTARVIKVCGFNLNTATVEDLDKDGDLRVIYTNYLAFFKYIPIMNWRTAAYQVPRVHGVPHALEPVCGLASKEHQAAVTASEATTLSKGLEKWFGSASYRCGHCDELSESKPRDVVFDHLKEKHNIPEATSSDFIDERKNEFIPPPVYLVPRSYEQRHSLAPFIEHGDLDYLITYWKIDSE
ncbi:hypothetical protein BDY19DRAFT_942726 [Irpex rosettiformis]|uniref:Uncharacterized protein n=1 Tax=Irpex rosettiformis TaxID=378272 RepID=A0ACB8U5R3_9APHY|nr:hypothetical protein BDY19DRAFT_942726 [Irpex rosettiformis]